MELRLTPINSPQIHIQERLGRVFSCECNLMNTTITQIRQEEDITDDCCGICVTLVLSSCYDFLCFTSKSAQT